MTQMFFNQGDAVDRVNQDAQLAATGEVNRKPGQTGDVHGDASLEQKLVGKSRTGWYLGALAAVVLIAAIGRRSICPRCSALPAPITPRREAQPGADAAAARRRAEPHAADVLLTDVLKGHPKYLDAQADRALILEFRWDDLSNQVRSLREAYEALEKDVAIYNKRKEPADWMAKANADIERMKQMHGQYGQLVGQEESLGREAFKLAQDTYKADASNASAARALAFYYADQNDADKTGLFLKKYEKVIGKKDAGPSWRAPSSTRLRPPRRRNAPTAPGTSPRPWGETPAGAGALPQDRDGCRGQGRGLGQGRCLRAGGLGPEARGGQAAAQLPRGLDRPRQGREGGRGGEGCGGEWPGSTGSGRGGKKKAPPRRRRTSGNAGCSG